MLLRKANPNHGKDGRFSSGPGGVSVPFSVDTYHRASKSLMLSDGRIDEKVAKQLVADIVADRESGEYPYPFHVIFSGDLAVARKTQGFDGKPKIVDDLAFDAYAGKKLYSADDSDGQSLYRGDSKPKYLTELMEGPFFAGTGVHGSGTYASGNMELAERYGQPHGVLSMMKIHPDARVVSQAKITELQHSLQSQLGPLHNAKRLSIKEFSVLRDLSVDAGCVATMLGYDLIEVNSDVPDADRGFALILNRTAIVFPPKAVEDYSVDYLQKANPNHGKDGRFASGPGGGASSAAAAAKPRGSVYKPAKKSILNKDGSLNIAMAKQIADHPAVRESTTADWDGPTKNVQDGSLVAVREIQGFNGKPHLVKPAELDSLSGEYFFRGDTESAFSQEIKTGTFYGGLGGSGNGTYASKLITEAASYANRYHGEDVGIIEFKLHPNARITKKSDGPSSPGVMHRSVIDGIVAAKKSGDLDSEQVRSLFECFNDSGRLATALGWDAYTPGNQGLQPNHIVVLNRTAMIIADQKNDLETVRARVIKANPNHGKDGRFATGPGGGSAAASAVSHNSSAYRQAKESLLSSDGSLNIPMAKRILEKHSYDTKISNGQDHTLVHVREMQGFNGKPHLVQPEDFVALRGAKELKGETYFRGDLKPAYSDEIKSGSFRAGIGTMGHGTYASKSLVEASAYAGRTSGRDLLENPGGFIRFKMHPSSRLTSVWGDGGLDEQRLEVSRAVEKAYVGGKLSNSEQWAMRSFFQDNGRLAAALGWDGYTTPNNHLVVQNRTAMMIVDESSDGNIFPPFLGVQKANPNHGKDGRFSSGPGGGAKASASATKPRGSAYKPAKESIMNPDGSLNIDVAKRIADNPDVTNFVAGHEDHTLVALREMQGFNGKPQLVKPADFDSLSGGTLYRGETELAFSQQMKTGAFYGGKGAHGNGTYSAKAMTEAAAYADVYDPYKSGDKAGGIIRFKMHPSARIAGDKNGNNNIIGGYGKPGSYMKIVPQIDGAVQAGSISPTQAKTLKWYLRDVGHMATALGFDAYTPTGVYGFGHIVVLNRTAMIIADEPDGVVDRVAMIDAYVAANKPIVQKANPNHGKDGRFASGPGAGIETGPKVHPAVAALPPALGTAPLPDGMVRMYHQTDPDNIPSIEKHGLLWDKGTGVEGPKGVWVADKPFYGLTRNLATIEVAIPKADREIMGHIASIGDIPTSRILTINMEWHDKVREFVGSNYERSLWAGEYDQLLDDPNLAEDTGVIALRYMRDNGIGKPDFEKSNPNHGKDGRFASGPGGGAVSSAPAAKPRGSVYKPAKESILNGDGSLNVAMAKRIGDLHTAEGEVYRGEDKSLTAVREMQGFNGKPRLVGSEEFSSLKGKTFYRGDVSKDNSKQIKTGAFYGGIGVNGHGTYASQEIREGIIYTSALGYNESGGMIQFKLHPSAKIMNKEKVMKSLRENVEAETLSAQKDGRLSEDQWKHLSNFLSDDGRFAAALGFDAFVYNNKHRHVIVLNRTAMIIDDDILDPSYFYEIKDFV